MTFILSSAAAIAIIIGIASYLLLRSFPARVMSASALTPKDELPLQHLRRMEKLLSPADCEFARSRGASRERLRQLRTARRKIYRAYRRDLVCEFNTVCRTLQLLLVTSAVNRPELATELARQRFTFYRALALTEVRLALHACGWDQSLSLDMVQTVETMRSSLQQLVQVPSAC